MPTTFSFRLECSFNSSYCFFICSISLPPTVPTPHIKRLRTLYSDRKNESCNTFKDFLKSEPFTTKEMFISDAPWAMAIMLIPERPSVPNNFPVMPGECFIFSPTIATVAKPLSAYIGNIRPSSISSLNSSLRTLTALTASSSLTPIDVLFSDAA